MRKGSSAAESVEFMPPSLPREMIRTASKVAQYSALAAGDNLDVNFPPDDGDYAHESRD
jgi:hypothetical protein